LEADPEVCVDKLLAVGIGGFAGACARWALTELVQKRFGASFFGGAGGTLLVNVLGCFALGALAAWWQGRELVPNARLFLAVGVLGSFTTFSTFSFETLELASRAGLSQAAAYAGASLALGLVAVGLGAWVVRASGAGA
jgi:CrcB protein